MLKYNLKNLRKIGNSSYKFLNDLLPILFYETDNIFLHNPQQINQNGNISKNTFEGRFSCGASCYLLQYFLERHDIRTKAIYSKRGYGKHLEDHCFLQHSNYIIDPTYRQMFSRQSLETDNYLFHNLPWIFVGEYNEIENIYNNLFKINSNISSENKYFWKYSDEMINNNLPLSELMKTGNFSELPHECFEVLYNEIKENEKKYFK